MVFLRILFSHNAMSEYIFLTLQVFCSYIMVFDFVIGFWFCDLGDFCVSILSLCLYVILVLSLSLFAFLFIGFFCHIRICCSIWSYLFISACFFSYEREKEKICYWPGGQMWENLRRVRRGESKSEYSVWKSVSSLKNQKKNKTRHWIIIK